MTFLEAIVLGIVEGLTEFLPVSSTGHLILTARFLNLPETDFVKAFQVIIQSAAMLAVILEYRKTFLPWMRKPFSSPELFSLFMGFLPAAVLGLMFGKSIKEFLFNSTTVGWALILGGILILVIERIPRFQKSAKSDDRFDFPSAKQSFKIGLFQCMALVPGVSRSLSTIFGARWLGMDKYDATLFSFYLAVPTLMAASVYDLFKNRYLFMSSEANEIWGPMVVGFVVSFLVSWICIRVFIRLIKSITFVAFGWYRILIGVITLYFFSS